MAVGPGREVLLLSLRWVGGSWWLTLLMAVAAAFSISTRLTRPLLALMALMG